MTERKGFQMQPGDLVEDFTLQNQDGKDVSLSDFKGSPVILFFYPRADTPGCTIESCGFRDAFKKFQREGIVVLGISRDTIAAQKKFKDKYDLPYDLLADDEMTLINRYDLIKPKNMYGKLVKGVKRTTYLIGPDQRLLHIFEEVKPEGHAEEVFAYLKQNAKKKYLPEPAPPQNTRAVESESNSTALAQRIYGLYAF